jgi:MFS family permease
MTDVAMDRSYAALFRVPALKRLLLGMIVARVAGSMVSVAMILFSLTHFGSPALTGLVTFASLIPGVLFSPIAGALLDRTGRTKLVIFDYFTSGLALFAIAGLDALGILQVWELIVIVALSSVTASLSNAGLRSLFPILVPSHLWQRVNVVDSNAFVLAQLLGPPIAGTLISIGGGDIGLALIGALFAVAAVVTIGIPDPPATAASSGRLLLDAWHGIVYTLTNATLRGLAVAFTTAKLGTGVMAIVMPVVLLERLQAGPAVVGIAWGVSAASQFVGALVMGRLESGPRDRILIAGSFIAYGAALGLFLAPPSIPLVLLAMVLTGALNAPSGVTMFTMRQRRTDPAWTGRAFAISMSLSFAGYPLGSVIAGAFAEQSVAGPILFGMATCVLAGLLALWLIPAHGQEFGSASASASTAAVARREVEPAGERPRA